jgi:phosphohistidine phosphatase
MEFRGRNPVGTERKTLYLVRHAKSSWKDSSLSDIDRPLNKRGRRSAPEMGRRMLAHSLIPELIVSSPANRARTTAGIIAEQLGYDPAAIEIDDKLYFSGMVGMQQVIEGLDDSYTRVMLTGHNPTMTFMMNDLANTHVDNMPTCAVAVIGFDMASWADLGSVDGYLIGYDYPKGSGTFTV